MAVRIFKLAKELDMSSKELIAYLKTQGINAASHMSTVEDAVAQILKDRLPKKVQAQKAIREAEAKRKAQAAQPSRAAAAGSQESKRPAGGAGPGRKGAPGLPPPGKTGAAQYPPGKAGAPAARSTAPGGSAASPAAALRDRDKGARPQKGLSGNGGLSAAVKEPAKAAGKKTARGESEAVTATEAKGAGQTAFEELEPEVEEEAGTDEKRAKVKDAKGPTRKRFFPGADDYGYETSVKRLGGLRRPRKREGGQTAVAAEPAEISIRTPITIKDLSGAIGVKVNEIISFLMSKGLMLAMNSYLDQDQIGEIAQHFHTTIKIQKEESIEDEIVKLDSFQSAAEKLMPRAPVVTFLGHVDHGKTSLLDFIRKTKVVARESGGITQHLGAYRVDQGNIHVVFIDTPGHRAFTEMRARGANVTDVAVLVVAADEGVMPQTEEAFNHAKAAGVPIVVVLNKIDKPSANAMRCKEMLSKLELIPVEWGGKTEYVEVSALTGQGIDNLLEVLSLESQILELKADPTRPATGVVLEAASDPGRGIIATVLVRNGTLHVGDTILCGSAYGRVRNLWLNGDQAVREAGPASPVQISGLSEIPENGERFHVFADPLRAREIAEERKSKKREVSRARGQKLSLENIWEQLEQSEVKEVRLILKADVKGTLEALRRSLEEINVSEVKVRIIHALVGTVNQEDVQFADASQAIILGFNVKADDRARALAEEKQVEIRTYQVIYNLIDDVKKAIEDRLSPTLREEIQGRAEIRQIYRASKIGNIAGCIVKKGSVFRDSQIRLIRNGKVIFTGTLDSLKRFKDDAREVKEGFECGMKIQGYDDVQEEDIIEAFTIVKEKRSL